MTLRCSVAAAVWLAVSAISGAAEKPNGYESGKVWQVALTIDAAEYTAMQPKGRFGFQFGPPKKEPEKKDADGREMHRNTFGMDLPWATGAVTVDGETFAAVGVRYKGNGTIGDASRTAKKSFKIDLDRHGGTGRVQGSKSINLHCGVADPSKAREVLGYGLYRAAGVPAPRTAFAEVRLTVPGKFDNELLGLYTVVEEVDKPFLRAHFKGDKGLLMKPEGLREFEDKGDDWAAYKKQYAPKREPTPAEAKRVIAFARLVQKADDATFRKEIADYLDIDGYLRYLAVTSYIANSDSFFALGHNYYLYLHPATNKFHFLPWDVDRAFSNLPVLGTNDQQMNLSLTHPYAGAHRLTDRLLATPGVSEKYQTLLKELSATVFDKARLLKELAAVEAATKDLIAKEATASAARKEGNGTAAPLMFGKPPGMAAFFEKRTESVAAQLAGTSKGHVPTAGFGPGAFKIGPVLAGPLMTEYDADKDGKMSKAEWAAAAKKVYDACAKTPEGKVTEKALADAVTAMMPKPPEGAPQPPAMFRPGTMLANAILRRADADKDGHLTLDELTAAADKLFVEADKDKAGKLDETAFGELLTTLFPVPNFGPPPKKD